MEGSLKEQDRELGASGGAEPQGAPPRVFPLTASYRQASERP